jgi:carbon monoxide dehydrogenase subunit G
MKTIVGVVIGAALLLAALGGWQYWRMTSAASRWSGSEELVFEEIAKNGRTWTVRLESVIAKPIDQVWEAMQQPERSAEFIPETFKKSELKSSGDGKKIVEMQIQVLTLPVQTFLAEMTYDAVAKTVSVETRGGPQELVATYRLESSPDGTSTRIRYSGKAEERINVPLPESVQKGAMRALFVSQVRAIERGIEQELRDRAEKAA